MQGWNGEANVLEEKIKNIRQVAIKKQVGCSEEEDVE